MFKVPETWVSLSYLFLILVLIPGLALCLINQ